jgi:hypothetical protein
MNKVVYICVGTCKAEISEEQYKGGLIKCGGEACTLKGHDFAKRLKCKQCDKVFKEDEKHSH